MSTFLLPLLVLASQGALAQSTMAPNCVTGRMGFNAERMINYPATGMVNTGKIDPEKYDMTIDYGPGNVMFGPPGASLALQKSTNGGSAIGARLSTVRWLLYGRITLRMTGIALPGVVTTFITMSERKDEIDWEFVGGNVTEAQTNVFYKGIQEFNTHNTKEALPSRIDQPHTFTIDWKKDTLSWLIDGEVVRTVYRENATSPMTPPGERWFPSTPSQIQLAVWDGGSSPDKGTRDWAGGPIPWGAESSTYAQFESLDIQCYDDNSQPVQSWPTQPGNPSISYPPSKEFFPGTRLPTAKPDGTVVQPGGGNGGAGTNSGRAEAVSRGMLVIAALVALLSF